MKKRIIKVIIIILFVFINSNIVYSVSVENTLFVSENGLVLKNMNTIKVFDYEGIFSDQQKKTLNEEISRFEEESNFLFLIVTTHSIGNFENIQDYATNLGVIYSNETGNPRVVIIAVSNKLKKIAISTSTEARKAINDKCSKKIIDKTILPKIRSGSIFDGLVLGLKELFKLAK